MPSYSYRLDRFINQYTEHTQSAVRLLIAQRRILVDGLPAESVQQKVSAFTHVSLDGKCLQNRTPVYIKLNKPKGVVSATKDPKHTTVIDLLDHAKKSDLHIVGRLDFNTTGLMLLTNDGTWSKKISLPETKLEKVYHVTLADPIDPICIDAFKKGIYLAYEDITTKPATLNITSDKTATLTLTEGKYHQIKRMFGHFRNEVISLHRLSVGHIVLNENQPPGASRELTPDEINF